MNNNMYGYNQYQMPKKKTNIGKIVLIILLVVIAIFAISFVIGMVILSKSNKLICESNEGNITIYYNDTGIVGYNANGLSYDLDGQKAYATKVGINAYLTEFESWFTTNTTCSCTIKEK